MRRFITVVLFISVVVSVATPRVFYAQTVDELTAARQAALQAQLDQVLADINAQKKILATKQLEGISLERDIAILDAQITKAQLQIKAKQINIQQLGKDINTKTEHIQLLGEKAEQGKDSLGQLLKKTQYLDDFNLFEIVLSNKNLSEFLQDLDSYYFVKQSLNQSLDIVKQVKITTEGERSTLDKKRNAEMDAKMAIESEQKLIKKAEAQKQVLLGLSKKEQTNYKGNIKNKELQASAIRAALFALRDSAAIPFGKALEYANIASQKTGVRPAFILGILTQESDLGKNIGTCNRPQDPPEKKWTEVMKPSRDIEPFKRITAGLGLDPNTVPVSCPIGNGWGGAMGPSQFIPSTWESYVNRIKKATGADYANPWNPRHAIMATAIYVSDLGADAGTFTAERTAALKYYAGSNWNKPQNAFYGNQVMKKTNDIQENMINPLQNL